MSPRMTLTATHDGAPRRMSPRFPCPGEPRSYVHPLLAWMNRAIRKLHLTKDPTHYATT